MTRRVTTIVDAEVDGALVDVRIEAGVVAALEQDLPRSGSLVIEAGGISLIPGLHDHHLHLLAVAAADRSVDVAGAPDADGFDELVRGVAHDEHGWLRVVGLDDRHGPIDRQRLDVLAPGRKVRVQHRSGAAWVLNSAGLATVGETSDDGWLHRSDEDLRRRWDDDAPTDLGPVGARLSGLGVTGVTDATPFTDLGGIELIAKARAAGDLPQRVFVTGAPCLACDAFPTDLDRGPVKVVVSDDSLPAPEELIAAFRAAHHAGRPVAVHCVTRVALVLALVAWRDVGVRAGDRIEHGSVIPVELLAELAELGLQVVTQPAFVWARGDQYLDEVDDDDLAHLYRCRSLDEAGIGVAGSTDAPFGPLDPWLAMRAAVERRSSSGRLVGPDEAVPGRRALDLFLSPLADPAGPPRRIAVGSPADLCLLDSPLAATLEEPDARHVRATWIGGALVHGPATWA